MKSLCSGYKDTWRTCLPWILLADSVWQLFIFCYFGPYCNKHVLSVRITFVWSAKNKHARNTVFM